MPQAVLRKLMFTALALALACGEHERATNASDAPAYTVRDAGNSPAWQTPTAGAVAQPTAGAVAQPTADAALEPDANSGGRPADWRPTSDTLTELPRIVYLKTSVQTFNRLYYFAVLDGELWMKPNVEVTGSDQPWQKVPVLPEMQGKLRMVSTDDHGIVVFDDQRKLYWSMSEALNVPFVPRWQSAWGAPLSNGPGLTLPDPILKWEFACLTRAEDDHFIDPAGNHQLIGLGSVAHVWILNDDGQRITYVDPILPVDTSYEMCGPQRGRFRSVNFSTSGSTAFVIDQYGDMYTRLYDFDISGADTLFFTYSYDAQPGAPGAPIKLPAPDWVQQPKISGRITDRITIFKTGKGSDSRVLRVEGADAAGATGYYEKTITAGTSSDWKFHETGDPLRGNELDNSLDDRTEHALGAAEDREYSGVQPGWVATLQNFNLYCSPASLHVAFDSGESLDLVLHHTDAIRQEPRMGRLTDVPRELHGTIEVPDAVWSQKGSLGPDAKAFVAKLSPTSRFTAVPLTAALGTVSLNGWQLDYTGP